MKGKKSLIENVTHLWQAPPKGGKGGRGAQKMAASRNEVREAVGKSCKRREKEKESLSGWKNRQL